MDYEFSDGASFSIEFGEDGYTANFLSTIPMMGTFTDLEKLLDSIAPLVHRHIDDELEIITIAMAIDFNFRDNNLGIDGIKNILKKL